MQPTGRRDIVVIGGSAGSVEAVKLIACGLSHELLASVLVVLHTPPRERNLITEVLNATSSLPASEAAEGEPLVPGRIYVPPPDRHLIVAKDHVHVARGPKEGLHRPSINMTFRSAANSYAKRVIGVLLSGQLDDGASGLWEIARHGGVTIVQDPEEALFPSMPRNALHDAPIDYRVRSDEIAPLVNCLVSGEPVAKKAPAPQLRNHDEKFSGFSCPECHGPLWQVPEGPPEFQCRVGHTFSLKSLIDEHASTQERKLYEAILALEEGAALSDRAVHYLGEECREELTKEAEQLRRHASAIRRLLEERIVAPLE